jgi:hypothetical protein
MTTAHSECIARNECPVCHVPRRGVLDPRKALQEHLRRATDAEHKMWFEAHYKACFPHGGNKIGRPAVTEERIKQAIRTTYGEEWAGRVTITAQ